MDPIEAVPVKRVDWNRLIYDSIWRVPPFVDKDDKDFEKGFRDALILETVVEYCRHHAIPDTRIAFVCGDKLLCEAVSGRLAVDQRFSVYESFLDFESYLSLTKQKLTDQFIRNILRRAGSKFFTKGDESCLARRADVPGKMRKQFHQYFNDPASAQTDPMDILSSIGIQFGEEVEVSLNAGMNWVGSTVFERIENNNTYYWKTTVTFAQLFQRTETQYGGIGLAGITEVTKQRVLVLPVTVKWRARVTTDARFHDIETENLTLGEKDSRAPRMKPEVLRPAEHQRSYGQRQGNAPSHRSCFTSWKTLYGLKGMQYAGLLTNVLNYVRL